MQLSLEYQGVEAESWLLWQWCMVGIVDDQQIEPEAAACH